MEIVLEGVSKRFGSVHALENVSLTIGAGQVVAVVGPNGAGKTTMLRCLAAIATPDAGRIFYDGERFHRGRVDLRSRLAFLPDFPLVFPGLTVARHIAMILGLYGIEGTDAAPVITRHLEELDLLSAVDTRVGQLSRGQIYKTALTALMSVDPQLWMMDEPFASGMDPGGIAYFKKQARAAAGRGRTVLYTTQILDVAEKFSDRVCIIHRGKLRFFETVANLPGHDGEGSALEEVFRKLREEEA